MKNSPFGNKLNSKITFVKPLYRKAKTNRVRPGRITFISLGKDNNKNLVGYGTKAKNYGIIKNTKTVVEVDGKSKSSLKSVAFSRINKLGKANLCYDARALKKMNRNDGFNGDSNMLRISSGNHSDEIIEKDSKEVQATRNSSIVHTLPDSWLRVYPATTYPGESVGSIVFRCTFSQLGLIAILVIWTVIWALVIFFFEGPYEVEASLDFEKKQNQLVIDLATELRQITPLAPRWREAIERRIEEERQLTMTAVARGAKINPGRFWDPSGTCLFMIYVMTALGFGAPVPQTIWGRTSVLIYAAIAIPTHVFLMLNSSTCMVIHLEKSIKSLRNKGNTEEVKESPLVSSPGLEVVKAPALRERFHCFFNSLVAFHCIPQAVIIYYLIGALSFGLSRHKDPWDIVMFPLEFTTTGGLQHIEGHVRLIYAFYVEGAMILLACILAVLRRHSNATRTYLREKYNLFTTEQCAQCVE